MNVFSVFDSSPDIDDTLHKRNVSQIEEIENRLILDFQKNVGVGKVLNKKFNKSRKCSDVALVYVKEIENNFKQIF